MTSRRTVLKQLSALSLLPAAAAAREPSVATTAGTQRQRAFANALAEQPWLGGYRSAAPSGYDSEVTVQGRWPEALQGVLYRNGPALHELQQDRYRHWFDGDGMLQSFALGGAALRHRGRVIETPKLLAERAAQRRLFPAFDTTPAGGAPMNGADDMNPANISVLAHHDRLYALWEAGSAVEMNPDDLSTIGLRRFSEATEGVPFAAHPRLDRDGSLWNFGYLSSAGALVLWHLDRAGKVADTSVLRLGAMSMPHDMVLTERYLVLLIPPYLYDTALADQGAQTFLEMHRWQPEEATRALVIDKNDLSNFQTIELPAQWVFHFGNGYDDGKDRLRFHGMRAPEPSILTGEFRAVMRGDHGASAPATLYEYTLDLKRGIGSESPLFANGAVSAEFPSFDPRQRSLRYEQLVMLSADPRHPTPHGQFSQVRRSHLGTGAQDVFNYPISQIPEEHLYVPDPARRAEQGGWIIGTAYDFTADRTVLNLFAAEQLSDGPIASATLPYATPLGLHGTFVPA
ncbi:MAG: carotenoid oxygenase family protein [Pseudomonadota bacterium]